MKKTIVTIILGGLLVITGCAKSSLEETREHFSDKGFTYSFQLPKDWDAQEEYQSLYNPKAVFGAEDQNSKSYMFIRTKETSEVNSEKLKEQTKQELKKNYKLAGLEAETFKVNNLPSFVYIFQGIYNQEEVIIYDFYVILDQRIVELTFYSAVSNNVEKQAESFKKSVKTLLEERKTVDTTDEPMETSTNLKIENEAVSFTLTGYKMISDTEEKRLLIVRYLFLNKQSDPVQPNVWNSLVTAKQDGQELALSSVTESQEASDLSYLLQVGKTAIGKDDLVQTAVVYEQLGSSMSDISINFDQTAFKDHEPIILPIKK